MKNDNEYQPLTDADYQPYHVTADDDDQPSVWPKVLVTLALLAFVGIGCWYFVVQRPKDLLFKQDEKVCIIERFDGYIVNGWKNSNGENYYRVLYSTDHGTQYENYAERFLKHGTCK